jgi:ACS family tartrate transporter-like MFS transporter
MHERTIFAKCAWRLLPLILLIYLINYVDRVNVGFAALTMNRDLSFSPAVFGFGAGILFFGYSLFQVPANIILQRVGARRWIFSIMVVWGLLSAATALVHDPISFYVLRFALGVAEAGFFPGILLYLTFWFPQAYLARLIGTFMTGIPLAFVIGGPVSSLLLQMDGIGGLHGWQWLFIMEGLPATLLAFAVLRWLPDGPAHAEWLSAEEKRIVVARLSSEEPHREKIDFLSGLLEPRIWVLGVVLAGMQFGLYGTQLWIPQIVQSLGFTNFATGFVVAFSFLVAGVGMVIWGRSSDLKGERIWHIALPLMLGAGGLLVAGMATETMVVVIGLTVGLIGALAIEGPLFSLPKTFLTGAGAASGIAFLNTIGSLGRFLGPYVVGVLRQNTGNYSAGMVAIAGCLLMSAVVALLLGRSMATRKVQAAS